MFTIAARLCQQRETAIIGKVRVMAFVLDKFVVTFNLAGVYDGERSKTVEFLPVGADIAAQRAQLDTDIATWLTNFNNTNARDTGVSTAFVYEYNITEKRYESTNIPAMAANDNLYLEAFVGGQLENSTDDAGTGIPAPAVGIFSGDSFNNGTIDLQDAALTTFMTQYTAGGGNAALSDGEQLQNPVNLQYGRLRTVKAPKGGI